MAIKTQINTLLNKKMDRQDFLKHAAVGIVALSGVGTVLRLLAPAQSQSPKVSAGYGSSAYGGSSESKKTS